MLYVRCHIMLYVTGAAALCLKIAASIWLKAHASPSSALPDTRSHGHHRVLARLQTSHVGVSRHDELPCHRGGGAASHRCGQALAPAIGISGTASMSPYDPCGRAAAARG
jgi:hypothetical protein